MIAWRTKIIQSFMLIYRMKSTKDQKETKAKGKGKGKGKERAKGQNNEVRTRAHLVNQTCHSYKSILASRASW